MRLVWKWKGPAPVQLIGPNARAIGTYASADMATSMPKKTTGYRPAPEANRPSATPHPGTALVSAAATQPNTNSTQINHAGPAGHEPREIHACQNAVKPGSAPVAR